MSKLRASHALAVGALALGATATFFVLRQPDTLAEMAHGPAPVPSPTAAPVQIATPTAVSVPSAPVVGVASREKRNPPTGVSDKLFQAFAASRDYRAFALQAMQAPGAGGLFYARIAVDRCGMSMKEVETIVEKAIAGQVQTTGTVSQAQLNAWDLLRSRCASFAPEEVGALSSEIKKRAASGNDPILSARTNLVSAVRRTSTKNDLVTATQTLIETNDVLAVSADGPLLNAVVRAGQLRGDGQIRVFGYKHPVGSPEASVVLSALRVAACNEKQMCALDEEMLIACASRGFCYQSRRDHTVAELRAAGIDASIADKFDGVLANVTAQLRSANAAKLLGLE